MGIEALENFYKVIGMPKNMREAGVEEDKWAQTYKWVFFPM